MMVKIQRTVEERKRENPVRLAHDSLILEQQQKNKQKQEKSILGTD